MPINTATLAGPSRPLGDPDIPQRYLPASAESGVFTPFLYGSGRIHFSDKRRKVDETRAVAFRIPVPSGRTVDWETAQPVTQALLDDEPVKAPYLPLPSGAMDTAVFARWAKAFDRWLARTQRLELAMRTDSGEPVVLRPKRGGVAVDLVAIVWVLG